MLNHNNILKSKGPIKNKYSDKKTCIASKNSEIKDLINKSKDVIFIRNGSNSHLKDLNLFANNINLLKKPLILITSDGDKSVPSSYDIKIVKKILENDKILFWYTQNYDKSYIHKKLRHIPIGFDCHTTQWLINNSAEKKIEFMIKCRNESPTHNRISDKILSDSHLRFTHNERKIMYKKLINNDDIYFLDKKKTFTDITKLYNKYNFVLSPRGNGLDCHRTWELLLAGVIVITKSTSLDDMFKKNNLPVIILKDWDELNKNLPNKLKKWYQEYKDKTTTGNIFPKLKFNYWLKN